MNERIVQANLLGLGLAFKTRPGVFSKHRVDPGTQLLVETVEVGPNDVVLDLGCGYGLVGISLAKKMAGVKVILVDANIRAVRLAQENIKFNRVVRAEVRLSDGLEAVRGERFDLIVSNPPASAGLEILEEFAREGKRCLKPGGRIYFVTQERLKPTVERLFHQVFGNWELVKRSRGYIISLAKKEAA